MTPEQFRRLQIGDIVRNQSGSKALVVTGNYGDHVTAVLTVDMTNPTEWDVVSKANHGVGLDNPCKPKGFEPGS